MATIQAVLWRKPNAQKNYPIAIGITKDRKATYLFTGQYIDERFWDKKNRKIRKSHPNANRLNHIISQKLTESNDKLLQTETTTESFSVGTIKRELSHKDNLNFLYRSKAFGELEKQKQASSVSYGTWENSKATGSRW